MKDDQTTMSVEVSAQNGMALKTLPSVNVKDGTLYPVGNVPEDELSDESFHLHLSEDEDEEKTAQKKEDASKSGGGDDQKSNGPTSETEEEILNKFENIDNVGTSTVQADNDKSEETLLGDTKEEKPPTDPLPPPPSVPPPPTTTTITTDESNNKNSTDNDGVEKSTVKGSSEETNQPAKETNESEVDSKTLSKEKQLELEEADKEPSMEQEKSNEEILKTQIMDTEDLLQIVENDTERNDKESSSSNSPRSATEKPEESEDMEATESNDAATESEKMEEDEDDGELEKSTEKEDDAIDIEESSPIECDADKIDNEYRNIVRDEEMANKGETNEDAPPSEPPQVGQDEKTKENQVETMEVQNEAQSPPSSPKNQAQNESPPSSENQRLPTKRSLSNSETLHDSKKPKLQPELASTSNTIDLVDDSPVAGVSTKKLIFLDAFAELMQTKPLGTLTRKGLEQFCLQKLCETICHKSEIGELRHQLGLQEQLIEMWRKEAAQLTKQARDLEIVNKRLLHEVRMRNERDKPLVPVKITRSVGLQVRSDNLMNAVTPQKRRVTRVVPAASPNTPPTPIGRQAKIVTPVITSNGKPKYITAKAVNYLPKTQGTPTTTTTLVTATGTPIVAAISTVTAVPMATTTKTNPTSKQTADRKPVDKGFIDLTDEDDKRPTNSVRAVVTPQTIKTAANVVTGTNLTNSPRIMYLYNNPIQGVLGENSKPGTQKVMLKLNPNIIGQPGSVLATVPNGSTIAVSSSNASTLRTAQVQQLRLSSPGTTSNAAKNTTPQSKLKHPAPLPALYQSYPPGLKAIPPKPHLSIRRSNGGIVLSWKMPYNLNNYAVIASYQLYAYQETTSPPSSDMWRKVGDVKALALPMACTLTQFADGNKYHFAVRAVDVQKRMGPFSDPEQILL